MDISRWRRIRELAEQLVAVPEDQRNAWLAENEADIDLHGPVLALVDDSLTTATPQPRLPHALPTFGTSPRPALAWDSGQCIGPWRLREPLGEGGMGSVWLAERSEGGFEQLAAIKRVREGLDDELSVRRFEAERQMLAKLQHRNIAMLLDGGTTAEGQHWLALEYIRGEDILQFCDRRRLTVKQRIECFLGACTAVAYAHRQLIIHRDIKPSNVMVSEQGEVKLLDFGVAKLLDIESDPGLTGTQVAPVTPAYAAPEQLRGEAPTTQTDVYGLGLLLYELLCGLLPHPGRRSNSAQTWLEAVTSEPQNASRALRQASDDQSLAQRIANHRGTQLMALQRELGDDLDAILIRALRPQPDQRYASVEALVTDLQCYLQHRPVSARRGNRRYHLARFMARNRMIVGLSAMLLIALLGGLVSTLHYAARVSSERDHALRMEQSARLQEQRANAALRFQQQLFRQANPNIHGGRELVASDLLRLGEAQVADDKSMDPFVRATLLDHFSHGFVGLTDYSAAVRLGLQALALYQDLDDPEARGPEAALIVRMAGMENYLGDVDQALQRITSLLEGPNAADISDITLADALATRGSIHGNRGQREAAEADLKLAGELMLKVYGQPYQRYITTQTLRAYFLVHGGHEHEAEAVLRATRDLLGNEPVDGDIARFQLEAGYMQFREATRRHQEIIELGDQYLELVRSVFGDTHNNTARAYALLGRVEHRLGRQDKAIEWLEQALQIKIAAFGEGARQVLLSRFNLGLAYLFDEQLDMAAVHIPATTGDAVEQSIGRRGLLNRRQWLPVLEENLGQHRAAARLAQQLLEDYEDLVDQLPEQRHHRLQALAIRYAEDEPGQRCERLVQRALLADSDDIRTLYSAYALDCHMAEGLSEPELPEPGDSTLAQSPQDPSLARILEVLLTVQATR